MNRIARRIRAQRDARDFNRAVRGASPAMQQELFAAASRQGVRIY
jgi:hypothetical protein